MDVDAFARLPDGSLLLSVDQAVDQLPGVGPIADADVVQFRPSSMGANTSGQFSLYLDGFDAGLYQPARTSTRWPCCLTAACC